MKCRDVACNVCTVRHGMVRMYDAGVQCRDVACNVCTVRYVVRYGTVRYGAVRYRTDDTIRACHKWCMPILYTIFTNPYPEIMRKFKNKYRIPSARAPWWDYSADGVYFITICTRDRKHFFGTISEETMHLSHVGVIVDILWHEIPNHTTGIDLREFTVMPNHLHGIIVITGSGGRILDADADDANPSKNEFMSEISPKSGSLSTVLRSYKSAVTRHANRLGYEHGWHPRFHDHIIRDEHEYRRIAQYIVDNPKNWKTDNLHS